MERLFKRWGPVLLGLLVLAMAWRWRHDLVDLMKGLSPPAAVVPTHAAPAEDRAPRVLVPASAPVVLPGPPGVRKCRRGAQVTYTGDLCPPGFKEQGITGGTVTVVEQQPTGKAGRPAAPGQTPAAPGTAPAGQGPGPLEALTPRRDDAMHRERIERAVGP